MKMENKKGLFIAFEGIDGSGKTTQIKKFVHYLFDKSKHNHIVFTRNPYKNINIRAILREDDDAFSQADKLADLFISDRKKHSEEVVKPSIEKGHHVVTDRFKLSTISYQGAQGINPKNLIDRHEGIIIPDATFVIDVPAKIAGERMKSDKAERKEHKFEKDLDFLESVRQNLLKSPELLPNEKIFIIDGTKPINEIFGEVKNIFEREFSEVL